MSETDGLTQKVILDKLECKERESAEKANKHIREVEQNGQKRGRKRLNTFFLAHKNTVKKNVLEIKTENSTIEKLL